MQKKNLLEIYTRFNKKTGITFETQMCIFESRLKTFCKRHNIKSFSSILSQIKSDTELEQKLTNHLTTNETYFFREIKQIKKLIKTIKLNKVSSKIEILCAPCSTGEEPYSISIILLEAGITNFHITSIDINSQAIQRAKEAKYTHRHVKNLPKEKLKKYFLQKNDFYFLHDKIKKHSTFKIVNIFDKDFNQLGKFDYIFSRNMLIYFEQKIKLKAKKILDGMRKNDNVDIFLGHADLFI